MNENVTITRILLTSSGSSEADIGRTAGCEVETTNRGTARTGVDMEKQATENWRGVTRWPSTGIPVVNTLSVLFLRSTCTVPPSDCSFSFAAHAEDSDATHHNHEEDAHD